MEDEEYRDILSPKRSLIAKNLPSQSRNEVLKGAPLAEPAFLFSRSSQYRYKSLVLA